MLKVQELLKKPGNKMTMASQSYWVYILLCENNTYYTGYTPDLEKRYQAHLDGSSQCKYTRAFKPLRIAQFWEIIGDKSLAMRLEYYIKKLSRIEKEKIIQYPERLDISLLNEARK